MSMRDDMEKALTLFKKPEVTAVKKPENSIAGRTHVFSPNPPAIIDRVFEGRPGVQPWAPASHSPVVPYGEANVPIIRDQAELPRMCASRRMPWMQRYIRSAGVWVVGPSVQVDPQRQYEQYESRVHDSIQFSTGDTGYETCAWCGATGRGAIRCLNAACGAYTCHGTIYRRGNETWARCVCGQDSTLTMSHYVQTAIFPKVRAR